MLRELWLRECAELIADRLEGASSHEFNRTKAPAKLYWQNGYWARSVGHESLGVVARYVADQRQHHAKQTIDVAREQNEPTPSGDSVSQPRDPVKAGVTPPALSGSRCPGL